MLRRSAGSEPAAWACPWRNACSRPASDDQAAWNRTRAKAEPLAAKGGKIVDKLSELASCDVVFWIVSEVKDLEQVLSARMVSFPDRARHPPLCRLLEDFRQGIYRHPQEARARGADYVRAPVRAMPKSSRAGRLSSVVYRSNFIPADMELIAPQAFQHTSAIVSSRASVKLAATLMLGVVIENLIEITLLGEQDGRAATHLFTFLIMASWDRCSHATSRRCREPRLGPRVHTGIAAQGS